MAEIDPPRAIQHLGILGMALSEVMRLTKQNAGKAGAVLLLIGETQGLARWVTATSLADEPIERMALSTRGSMDRICCVICDADGARHGYLLSTLVSWQEYRAGYAVMEDHFVPPDATPKRIVMQADPLPAQEDVFDVM
jgi:hypothetical protein